MRKTYVTDLSDAEWACLKIHPPISKQPSQLRAHSLRDVFDAIFFVLRSGCPWRMLPGDFPPWSTVYYQFRRFLGWLVRNRHLKDYERKVQTSETLIEVATIRPILRRPASAA